MELTIYSKQLDLMFDVKISKSKKVKEIGLQLLNRFGYPNKTQFSIFNEDQCLELNNLIEVYSLNKYSRLSITFTNKFEINLIHKLIGRKEITIEAWDQFAVIKHQLQMEYGFSQSCEVCLRTTKQIYCLDFLIVHEDIHEPTNIWWEAYEILKYEFENNQYSIKIDISNDWDMIIQQIKEEQKIDKIIKINFMIDKSYQFVDTTKKYYQSHISPDIIFEITTPEEVILQIVYKEKIKLINIKQTNTVRDLINVAKEKHNLQIKKSFLIFYQENNLEIDENIQELNLSWNSILELREQIINTIQVQFKNTKLNQLIERQVDVNQKLIIALKEITNRNCINCTDFIINIDQQRIDQNKTFSELNISNNQIIEFKCDAIEINLIIGLKTLKYHAKKSHTLQRLEQEVKNSYQDLIPINFSIFKNNNFNSTQTFEELGLEDWNVSYTFLPLGKFNCKIWFDNNIELVECFEYDTIDILQQIIANKYSFQSKDIQSFYGYLPLNKDEQLKNIFVNDRFDIVMQKKEQIEIFLKNIDTDEYKFARINIDDPIQLALEREGFTNIKDISQDDQIIDLISDCRQLKIIPNSTLFYRQFQ